MRLKHHLVLQVILLQTGSLYELMRLIHLFHFQMCDKPCFLPSKKTLKELGLQITDWFDFISWAFLLTLVFMKKNSPSIVPIHPQEESGWKDHAQKKALGCSVAKRYDGVICKACDDRYSWGGGISSFELAGPSDQLLSQSVFSEPLLFCFVPVFFLSSDCVGGEVREDGVYPLGFVFLLSALPNSYFSGWFVFSISCTQQRGMGVWLRVSKIFDLRSCFLEGPLYPEIMGAACSQLLTLSLGVCQISLKNLRASFNVIQNFDPVGTARAA